MAGKGDRPRHKLGKQWDENYLRVFGKASQVVTPNTEEKPQPEDQTKKIEKSNGQ